MKRKRILVSVLLTILCFIIPLQLYSDSQNNNAISWKEIASAAEFGDRVGFTTVVFKEKMYVLGGYNNNKYLNSVYTSADGKVWKLVKTKSPFTPRREHISVVFKNRIWIIGGEDEGELKNDVWYSEDGVNWVCALKTAPFKGRASFCGLVFKDKL